MCTASLEYPKSLWDWRGRLDQQVVRANGRGEILDVIRVAVELKPRAARY